MNPPFRLSLALASGIVLTSCGLVPVPVPQEVPGVVTAIEVKDRDSGKVLKEATVEVTSQRMGKTWLRGGGGAVQVMVLPDSMKASMIADGGAAGKSGTAAEGYVLIPTTQSAGGRFVPVQTKRTALVWPWGLGPLGTAMHSDHLVYVTIAGRAHKSVRVRYAAPVTTTLAEFNQRLDAPHAPSPGDKLVSMTADGVLTVLLPRS